jgi:hypothetical protein
LHLDQHGEVPEDLVHVVDAPLDLADALLALHDERLRELQVGVLLHEADLLRALALKQPRALPVALVEPARARHGALPRGRALRLRAAAA